jgi:hypothetical protein
MHEKKIPVSLAMKEMQTKITLKFYLTPVRMTIIKKASDSKCWQGWWREAWLSFTAGGNVK